MTKNGIMALRVPTVESLDEGTRRYFERCREKLGFVPNVFQAYSKRPERFRKYQAYRNDLMRSELGITPLEREMIAVTVSSANRCHYCLVAHGQVLRELSGDAALADTIALNYRAASLSDRHRAMLDFAWRLTREPESLGDGDRNALTQVGLLRGRNLRDRGNGRVLQQDQPLRDRARHRTESRILLDEPPVKRAATKWGRRRPGPPG